MQRLRTFVRVMLEVVEWIPTMSNVETSSCRLVQRYHKKVSPLPHDPPRWFLDARESRTYFCADRDWEFFLRCDPRGEARVSVPLNRGDTPVYPAAASWLRQVMKDVDGAKRTWFGDFDFPREHVGTVERALSGRARLASRSVRLRAASDVAEFLRDRPPDIIEETHDWRLVLRGGKSVRIIVKSTMRDAYQIDCSFDGVRWDGTTMETWAQELVAASAWQEFRRAVLGSRPGRDPAKRERIDVVLSSFAAGEGIVLKRFEGSWKTASAKWRHR